MTATPACVELRVARCGARERSARSSGLPSGSGPLRSAASRAGLQGGSSPRDWPGGRGPASSGEDEAIPLAADGLDPQRLARIRLDLAAQLRDVDLARPPGTDVRAVPQRLHDHRAGYRPSRLLGEEDEEAKLGRRQARFRTAHHEASPADVDTDV